MGLGLAVRPANGRPEGTSPSSCLRIVTWNCRSGSIAKRLVELAEYEPHIVFLQECGTVERADSQGVVCRRTINGHKGIALIVPTSASGRYVARALCIDNGRATIAAEVLTPAPFTILGIWAQAPNYSQDVLLTLQAHGGLLRTSPAVVLGDLNSGSRLGRCRSVTRHHQRVVDAFSELGLVSAYHAFHGVDHGSESQATYFHQFKRSRPWHIDFCFLPSRWKSHLVNVEVIDGRKWAERSDHRPLLVELDASCALGTSASVR